MINLNVGIEEIDLIKVVLWLYVPKVLVLVTQIIYL